MGCYKYWSQSAKGMQSLITWVACPTSSRDPLPPPPPNSVLITCIHVKPNLPHLLLDNEVTHNDAATIGFI